MAAIAKEHQDNLIRIKENIEESYQYFKDNREMFHRTRNFIFRSNITQEERSKLDELQRPPLEFNILEAHLSRQKGEFGQMEPSFIVDQMPDALPLPAKEIDFVSGHLEAIRQEADRESFSDLIYDDTLSGGFSVGKVVTEYESERSFNQKIRWRRLYDSTLSGFDPTAREPHKGDGNHCFEIVPMITVDFHREFPGIDIKHLSFSRTLQGFTWSWKIDKKDVVMVAYYWEKKKKKKTLYYLAPNTMGIPQAMLAEDYEKMLAYFEENGIMEQPPAIISKRSTTITYICRYTLIENQILDYVETDYNYLPLVFFAGNSHFLKEAGDTGTVMEYTKPFLQNAIDMQRLMNVCGQTMANEIQLMVTHKFIAAKEGIPMQPEYVEAYINPQRPSNLIFNAFKEDGVTQIPPPQPVQRTPMPPEIPATFNNAAQIIQNIVGSTDMTMGQTSAGKFSGHAMEIALGASNGSAKPYLISFMAAMTQMAQISIDLFPKYYTNPRVLPFIDKQKKMQYQKVNMNTFDSLSLKYPPGTLRVSVKSGLNYEVQKSQSLEAMTSLAQAFPAMAELINTRGLAVLIDNLDIRGAEQLKTMAEQMMQQKKQQPPPPNPQMMMAQLKQQELQQKGQQAQAEMQLKQQQMQSENAHKAAALTIDQQKLQNDKMKTALDYTVDQQDHEAEMARTRLDAADMSADHREWAMDHAHQIRDQAHSHAKDIAAHHASVKQAEKKTKKTGDKA
jgi:hypothetical protein